MSWTRRADAMLVTWNTRRSLLMTRSSAMSGACSRVVSGNCLALLSQPTSMNRYRKLKLRQEAPARGDAQDTGGACEELDAD